MTMKFKQFLVVVAMIIVICALCLAKSNLKSFNFSFGKLTITSKYYDK